LKKILQLCPFFSLKIVLDKVDNLPKAIDLYSNPSWEVESIRDFENGEIVEKPIGIIPLEDEPDDEQKKGLFGKLGLLQKAEKEIENERKPKRFIPDVKFEDIGGIDEILTKVREVIELPIMQPELFKHLGIQPHKGIILHGPPGTGKTMIAKAIANEIKAHFILVNGPEILSKWVGESEKNLRNLFEEANKYQPSVIFFDEIDAIASKRSGSETGRNAAQIVNQLLTLFDGVKENKGVVILASTNRIELLDPAILRSGRFDYKIAVPNPNLEGCRIILEIKTKKMPVANSFNIQEFSKKLLGLSGAEIAFVVNEAAYNALRRTTNIKQLVKKDIEQSFDTIKIEKKDFEKALETLLTEKKLKTLWDSSC
jgi:transitional endoplasmic reticulum ATPase